MTSRNPITRFLRWYWSKLDPRPVYYGFKLIRQYKKECKEALREFEKKP